MKKDISELFERTETRPFAYREFAAADRVRSALERWPLLAQTLELLQQPPGASAHEPAADLFEGRGRK